MIIGVSGKSGSGKSYFSALLAKELDYHWIDIDFEVKKIREKYYKEIIELVGSVEILSDNILDSKKLGEILFMDEALMNEYNAFIYDKLKIVIDEYIKLYNNIIIDTMFLPIMDVFEKCDYKILLLCDENQRKQRILERESISIEYLDKREKFSLEYECADFDFYGYDSEMILKEVIEKIKK